MADYTTRDGSSWTPLFLVSIDGGACIGCARCFKVCDRDVMHLYGVDDEGEILGKIVEDDDDDFDGELNRKIMVADNDGACIGCNACARVCPKNCQSHAEPDKLAA